MNPRPPSPPVGHGVVRPVGGLSMVNTDCKMFSINELRYYIIIIIVLIIMSEAGGGWMHKSRHMKRLFA